MNCETPIFTVESEPVILENREGKWRVDSIVGKKNYANSEYVYFIENNFWFFRRDASPMLIDRNLSVKNNKIYDGKKLKYTITIIDSSIIKLTSVTRKKSFILTYNKLYSNSEQEYKKEIEELLIRDSLIRQTVGWWKMKKPSTMSINLPNNSDIIRDFTLYLSTNGEAIFYINHKLNKTINYRWEREVNSLSLSKGCIIEDLEINYLDKSKMNILVNSMLMYKDTLELIRCNALK